MKWIMVLVFFEADGTIAPQSLEIINFVNWDNPPTFETRESCEAALPNWRQDDLFIRHGMGLSGCILKRI
ncbi:MAG: hypothetical protein AAF986_08265 [Pseudomonadota bacterium]